MAIQETQSGILVPDEGTRAWHIPLNSNWRLIDEFIRRFLNDLGQFDLSSQINVDSVAAFTDLQTQINILKNAPTEKVQELGMIIGSAAIDGAKGNIVTCTVIGAVTFALTASTDAGYCRVLTLIIRNGGNYTVTWPEVINWTGKEAPKLTETGRDVITLVTTDSGVSWFGMLSGDDFA